jgi:hypothetical protein
VGVAVQGYSNVIRSIVLAVHGQVRGPDERKHDASVVRQPLADLEKKRSLAILR